MLSELEPSAFQEAGQLPSSPLTNPDHLLSTSSWLTVRDVCIVCGLHLTTIWEVASCQGILTQVSRRGWQAWSTLRSNLSRNWWVHRLLNRWHDMGAQRLSPASRRYQVSYKDMLCKKKWSLRLPEAFLSVRFKCGFYKPWHAQLRGGKPSAKYHN